MLSVQQCTTLACLLEIAAPKPGNVHRGADFEDASFVDFAASAVAIGPSIGDATNQRLGKTVLDAVRATRQVTSTNTNLGIVLLLAPLAAAQPGHHRRTEVAQVLHSLDQQDAADVFEAIRMACAGGLGVSDQWDVHGAAPADLMQAMRYAADHDTIARQYVTDFELVIDTVAPTIGTRCQEQGTVFGVVHAYLEILAQVPDSLVARKCGVALAEEVSSRAEQVVGVGAFDSEDRFQAISEFDFWLRSDGNRRNPGTTADLVTAGIFLNLLDGALELPLRI